MAGRAFNIEAALSQIKSEVKAVLADYPQGIKFGSFWGVFQGKHKKLPTPKDFKVGKRSDILLLCSDLYDAEGQGNETLIKLKSQLIVTRSDGKSSQADSRLDIGSETSHSRGHKEGHKGDGSSLTFTRRPAEAVVEAVHGAVVDEDDDDEEDLFESDFLGYLNSSTGKPNTNLSSAASRSVEKMEINPKAENDGGSIYDKFYHRQHTEQRASGQPQNVRQSSQQSPQLQTYAHIPHHMIYPVMGHQRPVLLNVSTSSQLDFSSRSTVMQPLMGGVQVPMHAAYQFNPAARNPPGQVSTAGLSEAVDISVQEQLTASILHGAPLQEQKQILGQHLFPLIHQMYPDLAGKITGMLLEIDNLELLHMLQSRESLKAKVEEAVAVLQAHQTKKEAASGEHLVPSRRQAAADLHPNRYKESGVSCSAWTPLNPKVPNPSASGAEEFPPLQQLPSNIARSNANFSHGQKQDIPVGAFTTTITTPAGRGRTEQGGQRQQAVGARTLNLSRDTMNSVVEDCIERLSEKRLYVSLERIEKLLLETYDKKRLSELGLRRLDDLMRVVDHIRMECKVNLYIQTFVKVRSICTVYELSECLREFVPERQSFESLHLGPLVRLPIIYEFFKIPTTVETPCEITTADVMQYLREWLSANDLWMNKQAKLEDLLKYIVDKRGVSDPYELGLRITSVPLAIQMLKKAQRDCGQESRNSIDVLKKRVNTELDIQFNRFTSHILPSSSSPDLQMCAVRAEYLQMSARDVARTVFGKLSHLYSTVIGQQLSWEHGPMVSKQTRKNALKSQEAIVQFLQYLDADVLMQQLFQLAVCCSREQVHFQLSELVTAQPRANNADDKSQASIARKLPNMDEVLSRIVKYLERFCEHGSLTLKSIAHIEARILTDFQLKQFADLSVGGFIEFLLDNKTVQHFLEDHGGSLVGSPHGGPVDASYNARLDDLIEFIGQCDGVHDAVLLGSAICQHYAIKDIRTLGHGTLTKLIKNAEKKGGHSRSSTVFYENALVVHQLSDAMSCDRSVGVYGHVTKEQALACLQNCPLLEDLSAWSQWDIVFRPELNNLKEFIMKHGGMCTTALIDGDQKKILSTNILALETRPGVLFKLTSDTSPDKFSAAALQGSVNETCGHLVSLIAINRGLNNSPLALLANHFRTALLSMHANKKVKFGERDNYDGMDEGGRSDEMIEFVLNCITTLPLVIAHRVINAVILDAMSHIIGLTRSKELLLQHARRSSLRQTSSLHALGLMLGIHEWTEDFTKRLATPLDCVEVIQAMDLDLNDVVNVESSESSDEDSDSSSGSVLSLSSGDSDIESNEEEGDENDKRIHLNVQEGGASAVGKDGEKKIGKMGKGMSLIKAASLMSINVEEENSAGEAVMILSDTIEDKEMSSEQKLSAVEIKRLMKDDTAEQSHQFIVDPDSEKVQLDGKLSGRGNVESHRERMCRHLIEKIRLEEFGCNLTLTDEGKCLVAKHQERLGRSLERLSKDLYSKDTHFVLELIQNADDNDYPSNLSGSDKADIPSLKFRIDANCITVLNNEVGFVEQNIRAVCDVGRTTKGKHKFGYIGQKGIGFKSVFRVTDTPQIHSNGYHIYFDVKSDALGYILPHWFNDDQESDKSKDAVLEGIDDFSISAIAEQQSKEHEGPSIEDGWMTRIVLPLKPEMKEHRQSLSLAARFRDIHPSLLLFLHRLRRISIVNDVEGYSVSMERRDIGDVTEITSTMAGVDRWLVIRKVLDASAISAQAKSGVEVESTEIGLAFPLPQSSGKKDQTVPAQKQQVFAFLPVRCYGFRFIIQGDFDVPSSREDVDRDSLWNQWLRSEIHHVFLSGLDAFKAHAEFSVIDAVIYFFQFVPFEDEIMDFFRPIATNILQQLRAKPCLPTQNLSWKLPSQLVLANDPLLRDIVSSSLLRQCLGLDFLHGTLASALSPQLIKSLGVQSLTTRHLIDIGKVIMQDLQPTRQQQAGIKRKDAICAFSKWLLCLYKSLDEFGENEDIISLLRTLPMIPLSGGDVTSLQDRTVFFPLSTSENNSDRKNRLAELECDLSTIDPLLFSAVGRVGSVETSQITRLLEQLGVKKLTAHDVIQYHILPTFMSDAWETKSRELLVNYIVYVFEAQEMSVLDKLLSCVVLLTNHGPCRPATEPIHFTPAYGNMIDLQTSLPGYDWQLLDSQYLLQASGKQQRNHWREFFINLGVNDGLAIRQKKVMMKTNALVWPWSEWPPIGLPALTTEYIVNDYECTELTSLIKDNKEPASMLKQMTTLFRLLNERWDADYAKYTTCQALSLNEQQIAIVESSFGIQLKLLGWIPAVNPSTNLGASRPMLATGKDLFLRTRDTMQLLADHVSYLAIDVTNSPFTMFVGIRPSIDVDFVRAQLVKWCARENNSKTPTVFETSLAHIVTVYRFLGDNLPPKQMLELAENHAILFYTATVIQPAHRTAVVSGCFLHQHETRWCDPTNLFVKYRESVQSDQINTSSSTESPSSLVRFELCHLYKETDLQEFFLQRAHVQLDPSVSDYLSLLVHICSSVPVHQALGDVLRLFSVVGSMLTTSGDVAAQLQLQQLARQLIGAESVIPSKTGVWVSTTSRPMIADDTKLEKLFRAEHGVVFIDCGEKIGVGDKRKLNKELADIDLEAVHKFLLVLGAQRLSESIKTERITENYRSCDTLQRFTSGVIPYIQRCLFYQYPETYRFLVQDEILKKLATMGFGQVGKFELIYRLLLNGSATDLQQCPSVIVKEKCRLHAEDSTLQFTVVYDHVDSYPDINKELARYFSCTSMGVRLPDNVATSSEHCCNTLKSLLSDIHHKSMLLEELMEERDIAQLPENEEVWIVKVPQQQYANFGLHTMTSEHDPMFGQNQSLHQMMEDESDDSGPRMKAWPPQSSSYSSREIRSATGGPPQIWPPPAPPEQMDRSQLPPDLRPSQFHRTHSPTSMEEEPTSATAEHKTRARETHPDEGDKKGTESRSHTRREGRGDEEGGGDPSKLLDKDASLGERGLEAASGDTKQKDGDGINHRENVNQNDDNRGDSVSDDPAQRMPAAVLSSDVCNAPMSHGTMASRNEGSSIMYEEPIVFEVSAARPIDTLTPRSGHKRSRIDSGPTHNDFVQPHVKQPVTFYGPPVWLAEIDDSMFEHLGSASNLQLPDNVSLDELSDRELIGQWGELLVKNYLEKYKTDRAGDVVDIRWSNETQQTGEPYDFVVRRLLPNGETESTFIEVKSTMSSSKAFFEISMQQIIFANNHGSNYHVYRVYSAGRPADVRLDKIVNLAEKLLTKNIRLMMFI